MRCEMESERTIRVDWKRPTQPPPPGGRPIIGPAIIPTVSSPVPFGAYLSDAERFRHIDSSVGSTINGNNSRAGLADVESLGDEEMVRETAFPVQIESREPGMKEADMEDREASAVPIPTGENQQQSQRPEPRRRRKVNKCPIILGCLLALAFLAILAIIIAWAVLSGGFQNVKLASRFSNVCSNKDCIEIAAGLTRSIDDKIPVCENFYRHTCGNFHYANPANPNQMIDYKTKLDEGVENEIHDILTNPTNLSSTSFSFQFSRSLFSQCTDFPLRESFGVEPLILLLRNLPCGPLFPGCNGFNEKAFSWERSSGMMDLYAGDLNIIVFDKDTNPQNPQEIILSFKAPDFSKLVDDSRIKVESLQPQLVSEFQALFSVQLKASIINSSITEVLGFKWDKNQQEQLEELIQLIVNLDELASISKQNNELPIILSLQEFSNMLAPIDLKSLFDASLSAAHSWSWMDTVLIQNPFYYQNLSQIIANSSKRSIANYLTLAAIFNLRPYLQIRGDSEDWRKCLKQMSALDPVANVYAQSRNFNFQGFSPFFSELKAFFVALNPQFSPNTLSILRQTDIKVGAPSRIFDDAGIQTVFNSIRIQDDSYEQRKSQNLIPWQNGENSDYFTNILLAMKQQRNSELSRIGTFIAPGDSVRWPSLETDYIFNKIENEMIIPMGLFQNPPLVIPFTPAPLSSVLATMGFLFYSKLYEIATIFESQISVNPCTMELYNQFVAPGTFIPSNYTQTANKYANALDLVLRKYREWKERNKVKHERNLPSFENFNDEQLTFLQFGALMCNTAGEEMGSLHEAMINTAVTILPEFPLVFNCRSNSAMIPRVSCNPSTSLSMPPPIDFTTMPSTTLPFPSIQ